MAGTAIGLDLACCGSGLPALDEVWLMAGSDTAGGRCGGKVFTGLILPNADAHIVKSELDTRLDAIVPQRGITQAKAERSFILSQSDVSGSFRGDFRGYSLVAGVAAPHSHCA